MALSNRITVLNGLYAEHVRARPGLTVAATAAVLSSVPLIRYLVGSYQGYMALGEGGIPHNVFGWLAQALLQPFVKHDLTSPRPYRSPKVIARYEPYGQQSFLPAPLPERAGRTPVVPTYVAPQRQITDQAGPERMAQMRAHLDGLAAANPALFEIKPSALEGVGTPAIHLRPGEGQAFMRETHLRGETAHVHGEGSTHLTLSVKDAEDVVVKGWGQRHKMSGLGNFVPWTYVLLYAPRNDDEFELWKGLVKASCAFVAGARKIEP